MVQLTKNFKDYSVHCVAIKMGNDWNISIYGGDTPHIGAVALGIPRESLLHKNEISSSVSILTITGHKEDVIVQNVAKKISSTINSTVVVSCGIHIDNITFIEIESLNSIIDEIVNELIQNIK